MKTKKLFVTCGLHASGVKELSDGLYNFYKPNAIIISRFEDVNLALSKHDVVIVYGHAIRSIARVSVVESILEELREKTEVICVMPMTPWIACIARDNENLDDIIMNELKWFQVPFYEEGFDDIVLVRIMPKNFDTTDWLSIHGYELTEDVVYEEKEIIAHSTHMFETFGFYYPDLRFGALYHDLGKLKTREFDLDEEYQTYDGYESVGAYDALMAQFYSNEYNPNNKDNLLENIFVINYHPYGFDPYYDDNSLLYKFNQTTVKEALLQRFGKRKTDILLCFAKCHEEIS